MKKNSIISFISLIVVLMASCTSSRPSYVLDDGDMEDLLYDIHRAHFIQQQSDQGDNAPMQYALFMHVLKQHGVSQAEWDSSLVYYTRHADEMEEIYGSLIKRLDEETSAMGAGVSVAADSTDIWKADKYILLTSDDITPSYQWKLDTDTLLKPGEKIHMRFLALFLNQNVDRRATALIALRFKNDSVITRQQVLSQTAIFNLEISDDDNLGIKSISGLFMLHSGTNQLAITNNDNNGSDSNSAQKNQILSITDIKLLHEDMQKIKREAEKQDSINAANRPDSVESKSHDRPAIDSPESPQGGPVPPPLPTNHP